MNPLSEPSIVQGPIQLVWDHPNSMLTPEHRGRFVKAAYSSAAAGQHGPDEERFWRQFRAEFLVPIHQWCQERQDRVGACYVPFPNDHLRVFVVRRSQSYDFTLSDDLSDLEMVLFEKHWPSEINQISQGHLEDFFDPAASIQIYGDGG